MERVPDRLARRWMPVTTVEARELLEAYQQLPDRTAAAAARVAVTAVTSLEPQGTSGPVQLRLSNSTTYHSPPASARAAGPARRPRDGSEPGRVKVAAHV